MPLTDDEFRAFLKSLGARIRQVLGLSGDAESLRLRDLLSDMSRQTVCGLR